MAYFNTKVADDIKRLEDRVARLEQALAAAGDEPAKERRADQAPLVRAA